MATFTGYLQHAQPYSSLTANGSKTVDNRGVDRESHCHVLSNKLKDLMYLMQNKKDDLYFPYMSPEEYEHEAIALATTKRKNDISANFDWGNFTRGAVMYYVQEDGCQVIFRRSTLITRANFDKVYSFMPENMRDTFWDAFYGSVNPDDFIDKVVYDPAKEDVRTFYPVTVKEMKNDVASALAGYKKDATHNLDAANVLQVGESVTKYIAVADSYRDKDQGYATVDVEVRGWKKSSLPIYIFKFTYKRNSDKRRPATKTADERMEPVYQLLSIEWTDNNGKHILKPKPANPDPNEIYLDDLNGREGVATSRTSNLIEEIAKYICARIVYDIHKDRPIDSSDEFRARYLDNLDVVVFTNKDELKKGLVGSNDRFTRCVARLNRLDYKYDQNLIRNIVEYQLLNLRF